MNPGLMDEEKSFIVKLLPHSVQRCVVISLSILAVPTGERYDENQFLPKLLLLISKYANLAIFW